MPTLAGVAQQNRGLTMVKVEGNIIYGPTSIAAATLVRVAGGIMPVTVDAFNAGAVPNPSLDNPMWRWNKTWGYFFDNTLEGARSRSQSVNTRYGAKIPGSDNLLTLVLRNIGAVTLDITINLRVLFRLP